MCEEVGKMYVRKRGGVRFCVFVSGLRGRVWGGSGLEGEE